MIVFAFKPPNRYSATFSLYDTRLDNPYSVPEPEDKISLALLGLPKPVSEHTLPEDAWWIRYDWWSLADPDREPVRVEARRDAGTDP